MFYKWVLVLFTNIVTGMGTSIYEGWYKLIWKSRSGNFIVLNFYVCVCVELMLKKKKRVLVCYKSLQLQFNIYMYDVMALCVFTIVKHKYSDVISHT